MKGFSNALVLLSTLVLALGCGDTSGDGDAGADGDASMGMDAGEAQDGGGTGDAATNEDASSGADGGDSGDAGSVADGGGPTDGGEALDGGAGTDAGDATDAGADAGPGDAGVDACVPPPCPAPPAGCSYVGAGPCDCGTLVCSSSCGGVTCNATEYCDYATPYACSGAGTCRPRPDFCTSLYDPVCGCDGATHSNGCNAHQSGTDVAADGPCGATSDCRTTGCPSGETCQECRGVGGAVWVCLASGIAC